MVKSAACPVDTPGVDDGTPQGLTTVPPDGSDCWRGEWHRVDPLTEAWAQSAVGRTVAALPALHPWRLGDAKGTSRLLQWAGAAEDAVAVLAVTARDPQLPPGEPDRPAPLLGSLLGAAVDLDWSAPGTGTLTGIGVPRVPLPDPPRWAGSLVRLDGTWLPPFALLPPEVRDVDDPGTGWATESYEFDQRFRVHGADTRVAAALLTPAVMALALDQVPHGSALTVSGDALHVWWPYRGDRLREVGRAARTARAAVRVAAALPRFVLRDHPDRGRQVEDAYAARVAAARAYREERDAEMAARRTDM